MAETTVSAENQAYLDTLRLYAADLSQAKDESARQKAADKFYKSLRAQKVNEKLISSSAEFFGAIVGKELEGANMLYAATSKQVDHVQNLQKDQASTLMGMLAQTQQGRVGVIGFVKALSTICRMFGADSFAESLDQKARDEESRISIPLNTGGITDGSAPIHRKMAEVQETLMLSGAVGAAGRKADKDEGASLRNPVDPFMSPAAAPSGAKAASSTTWTAYKQAMKEAGLSDDDVAKVMPSWMQSSKLSAKRTELDSSAEVQAFLTALKGNAVDLTAEKKGLAQNAVRKVAGLSSDADLRAPHPA